MFHYIIIPGSYILLLAAFVLFVNVYTIMTNINNPERLFSLLLAALSLTWALHTLYVTTTGIYILPGLPETFGIWVFPELPEELKAGLNLLHQTLKICVYQLTH